MTQRFTHKQECIEHFNTDRLPNCRQQRNMPLLNDENITHYPKTSVSIYSLRVTAYML